MDTSMINWFKNESGKIMQLFPLAWDFRRLNAKYTTASYIVTSRFLSIIFTLQSQ